MGRIRQENVAGIVGIVGDLMLLMSGDASGLVATAMSLSAELALVTRGHRAAGLALGWLLFSMSDLVLAMPALREGRTALAVPLILGAIVFATGAARLPIGRAAAAMRITSRRQARIAAKLATNIKPVCGLAGALVQLPIMAGASECGAWPLAAACAFWIAQDLLAGRTVRLVAALMRTQSGTSRGTGMEAMAT